MSDRLKTLSETAFNVTKIVAVIVAGAWTYYQWDRVIFPEESSKQEARAALGRVDVDLGFSDMVITSFGKPSELDDVDVHLVELSGVIKLSNTRSYPVQVLPVSTAVRLGHQLNYTAGSALTPVTMANEVEVELSPKRAFGDFLSEDGVVLESGGSATLAFNTPFLVAGQPGGATVEYVFATQFQLNALDEQSGAPIDGNSKLKSAYARLLDVSTGSELVATEARDTRRAVPTAATPSQATRATTRRPRPAAQNAKPSATNRRTVGTTGTGVFR